ncbi:MAG: trigger factor [Pelotomaculum sp.]|uniref:Trigger factor n=1 Tax=Pelotomaculum thermopropionicum (strain DSM 13744 / JCM 10971 / SI) TaxID=370438 RepID=TIG_PELTS|nr:RecName: Full=Trigger factor; Short=TF; AltName: Full=PPIase [Pelotomaculum thermopropionicum SI]NPV73853.1 trigger factor [Pelotomaculum sp.]BAF58984.1 FKBP-type peptidyl-prolyl cis-trans isomerase [Pelotomaculum thermopropionicum SI]
MKANAERIEKNTVLLEIEVDAEQLSQAMERAYRKLVKSVSVPGFRRGKTPRPIFERYVGKSALYEEAMDYLVPVAYFKAVEDTGIEPIEKPKVEVVQVEEGKPVLFKATVQVKPEVKLGQYKELELTRPSTEVSGEDVEKELVRLQNRYAKLVTLEEGTVEKGDTAIIDFAGRIDGEPIKGGEGRDYSLEIGSGSFVQGFEEQLVGMAAGETREIDVTFPENYKAEELAGKEAKFTVTVKEIKRKEIAPLDDDFAKDVSEFDTLEELRNDLSNKLKQAAENRAEYQVKMDAVTKAVDNAEVEIPEVMITNQLADMIGTLASRLSSQGLSLEDYLKYTGSTLEDMRASMMPEAERNVKTALVLEAIARAEGIKASDEEVDEEIKKMAAHYQQDPEVVRKMLEKEGQLKFIAEGLVREKTVKFLVENARILEDTNGQANE